jgi:hypothetical protein
MTPNAVPRGTSKLTESNALTGCRALCRIEPIALRNVGFLSTYGRNSTLTPSTEIAISVGRQLTSSKLS